MVRCSNGGAKEAPGYGIAVGSDGDVFVSAFSPSPLTFGRNVGLWRTDRHGGDRERLAWLVGAGASGIGVDPDGQIVARSFGNTLQQIDPESGLTTAEFVLPVCGFCVVPAFPVPIFFGFARPLAVDANGTAWLAWANGQLGLELVGRIWPPARPSSWAPSWRGPSRRSPSRRTARSCWAREPSGPRSRPNPGSSASTRRVDPSSRSPNLVRVELFGSEELDVDRVEPGSLRFGPGDAQPLTTLGFDLDRDGFQDRLLFFRARASRLGRGEEGACLWGRADGSPIGGCDTSAPPVVSPRRPAPRPGFTSGR